MLAFLLHMFDFVGNVVQALENIIAPVFSKFSGPITNIISTLEANRLA
jgi:hypothetical protein